MSKYDYNRYSPVEICTINTGISRIKLIITREDFVISLLDKYLELDSDVIHAATGNSYTDGNNIRLVNLGPIALFSSYKLITNSGDT